MCKSLRTTRSLRIVLFTTFVGFCSFYAPQPLLPAFAQIFAVSSTASAWLLTLPFITLALGPIIVGSFLQKANVHRVMAVACAILSLALIGFVASSDFKLLLFFRAIQALMLPIIFTAAVTYCSRAGCPERQQTRITLYITATIIGGFVGRLVGGFLGDMFNWQAPFVLFAVLSFICALAIWLLVDNVTFDNKPLKPKAIFELVQRSDIRFGLIFVFATFFTFAGTLNVIPFRLVSLDAEISSTKISLVYFGYSVGIVIPVLARWLVLRVGGELPTLTIGYAVLMTGLVGLFIPSVNIMLVVLLVISAGMFTIHATASGLLNKLYANNASLVNGAYISNYYSAAAVGSVLPVWVLHYFGWSAFVFLVLGVAMSAFWCLLKLKNAIDNNHK